MRVRTIVLSALGVAYVASYVAARQGVCFSEGRVLDDEEILFRALENIAGRQGSSISDVRREDLSRYVDKYTIRKNPVYVLPFGGYTISLFVTEDYYKGGRFSIDEDGPRFTVMPDNCVKWMDYWGPSKINLRTWGDEWRVLSSD